MCAVTTEHDVAVYCTPALLTYTPSMRLYDVPEGPKLVPEINTDWPPRVSNTVVDVKPVTVGSPYDVNTLPPPTYPVD